MTGNSISDAPIEKRESIPVVRTGPNAKCEAKIMSDQRELNYFNIAKAKLLAESNSNDSRNRGDRDSGIPKGCKFSPDGTCLLTARANKLELYNTPFEEEDETTNTDEKDEASGEDGDTTIAGEWEPAVTCNSGDSVRSYLWYPHMKSSDPASCCFLGVSRNAPVHLYDAYDGSIRATYRPFNSLDEMESPTTLCFVENGQKIVTGGLKSDRILHVFDINRPGREHSLPLLKLGKTRRSKDGQKGLVSAMAYSERNGVIAVGTCSPGSIYLYDLRTYSNSAVAEVVISSSSSTSSGGTVCISGHGKRGRKNKRKRFVTAEDDAVLDANKSSDRHGITDHSSPGNQSFDFSAAKQQWYQSRTRGGVTQVEFEDRDNSGTGHYLFSTSRRSNAILQWDLRKLSCSNYCPGIASFETNNDTNQRIEFQIHEDQLWTGGVDGCVRVYSHTRANGTKNPLLAKIGGFRDCVNGISLHPDTCLDTDKSKAQLEKLFSGDSNDDIDGSGGRAIFPKSDSLLAVAIGQRHFPSETDWENDDPHASLKDRTNCFAGFAQIYSLGIPQGVTNTDHE